MSLFAVTNVCAVILNKNSSLEKVVAIELVSLRLPKFPVEIVQPVFNTAARKFLDDGRTVGQ